MTYFVPVVLIAGAGGNMRLGEEEVLLYIFIRMSVDRAVTYLLLMCNVWYLGPEIVPHHKCLAETLAKSSQVFYILCPDRAIIDKN